MNIAAHLKIKNAIVEHDQDYQIYQITFFIVLLYIQYW